MNSFEKEHLNDDHCFLCGKALDDTSRSDEHVIPRWLQSKFDLWNKKLGLLNGTYMPYRQLLIPCCKTCNNGPLAQMEKEVESLLCGSFRSTSREEEFRLFQWCSKILYGLLHREMMLRLDRSEASGPSIVPREYLEQLTTFHHFMTSIRRPFRFVDFQPYSLFVVETISSSDPKQNFDYVDFTIMGTPYDYVHSLVLVVRIQHFGIVCVCQDNGYQKEQFQDEFNRFRGIPLHPIQFVELACKSAYKHTLLTFSPKYHSFAITEPNSEVTVVQANWPNGEIWHDWNNEHFNQVFFQVAERYGVEVPSRIDSRYFTTIFDADGSIVAY